MKSLARAIKYNTYPGELILNQIIIPNKLTVDRTAKLLGVTRPTLSKIINGKSAITPLMAVRISKVFGGNANLWVKLQSVYDLRKAKIEFEEKNIQLHKFEYTLINMH